MKSSGIRFYTLFLKSFKFKVTIKMLKNKNNEPEQPTDNWNDQVSKFFSSLAGKKLTTVHTL